jgi:hypothetical protein
MLLLPCPLALLRITTRGNEVAQGAARGQDQEHSHKEEDHDEEDPWAWGMAGGRGSTEPPW